MDTQQIVGWHRNGDSTALPIRDWTLAASVEHLVWLQQYKGAPVPDTPLWLLLRSARWPASNTRSVTHNGMYVLALPPAEDTLVLRGAERDVRERLGRAGFTPIMAKALSGALSEIIENVWEHAQATTPALLVYQCANERLTASIADLGIGVLQSLRSNPDYERLGSSLQALKNAMAVGVTRHTVPGRGYGFDEVLRAVADNHGTVRLRSGQGILVFRGSTDIRTAAGEYGVDLPGLHVALSCGTTPPNQPLDL